MARTRKALPARVDVAHLISAGVLASVCPASVDRGSAGRHRQGQSARATAAGTGGGVLRDGAGAVARGAAGRSAAGGVRRPAVARRRRGRRGAGQQVGDLPGAHPAGPAGHAPTGRARAAAAGRAWGAGRVVPRPARHGAGRQLHGRGRRGGQCRVLRLPGRLARSERLPAGALAGSGGVRHACGDGRRGGALRAQRAGHGRADCCRPSCSRTCWCWPTATSTASSCGSSPAPAAPSWPGGSSPT